MSTIYIPNAAFPGFKIIGELNIEQIKKICKYLDNMQIEPRMGKFADFLETININENDAFLSTLMSFSKLIRPNDVNFKTLSDNLANSYNETAEVNLSKSKLKRLSANLFEIFTHSGNLKLVLKASELIQEEDKMFNSSRIVTDIRMVFSDDLGADNRMALIIHRLNIKYKKNKVKSRNIVLSLDTDDLKVLKNEIERALSKESAIKKSYKTSFNFVNFSENE